ncbi:MAG: Rrf2 family transcriptional regulator [Chloroflexota bacterium]
MQITKQADYAVRAVRYLSERYDPSLEMNEQNRAPTREIAEKQHIPGSFLAKIISQLSTRKPPLLNTSRGASGGVTLAKEPKDISLLDVVEAIDGPIYLNECVSDSNKCTFDDDCPLKPIWSEAQEVLVTKLRSTRFNQFSNGHKK